MKKVSFISFEKAASGIILILFFAFMSCNSNGSKPVAGEGDLIGFEITDIPGSSIKYASRKDPAGKLAVEGYVLDNKKTGQWVEYDVDGRVTSIQHYVNGVFEGPVLKLTNRGQIDHRAVYSQGQLNGPWIQYKFGNKIEERNYKMGKLDGMVTTYNDKNWKVQQESEYKDGVQDGIFRYYDENGNMTLEYEYKNGEKVRGGMVEKN